CRQIDLNVYSGERRRHHEDNEQHEHHVDERRDVDLMDLVQRIIAVVETHDGPLVPTQWICVPLTRRRTMPRGRRGGGAVEIAANQREHLRRCVAKLRAVARNQARKRVIDDRCWNRGGEPECGGEQRLGNAGRDYRQIGGMRLRYPDEAVHDAPNGAEQSDKGAVAPMVASTLVPRKIRRPYAASIRSSRDAIHSLMPSGSEPADRFCSVTAASSNCRTSPSASRSTPSAGERTPASVFNAASTSRLARNISMALARHTVHVMTDRKRQPNQHRLYHRVGVEIHPPRAEIARQRRGG